MRGDPPQRIGDVPLVCTTCGWGGTLNDAEPDIDGEGSPGCPLCLKEANLRVVVSQVYFEDARHE